MALLLSVGLQRLSVRVQAGWRWRSSGRSGRVMVTMVGRVLSMRLGSTLAGDVNTKPVGRR